jgi:hypothetical protein
MEAGAMSCRPLDTAFKCYGCEENLARQVEMNLHHGVMVAAGGFQVAALHPPPQLEPAQAAKAKHVRAVCPNGHANLFYVEPHP